MKRDLNSRNEQSQIGRRQSLSIMGALGLSAVTSACHNKIVPQDIQQPAQVQAYDLNNPLEQLEIFEKLRGDLSGKKTYAFSEGRVFGIRPDLPEDLNSFGKEVFRFSGCSIRIKRKLANGNVETKSKNWLLYQDPNSGEFIDKMKNPYTGDVVDVPPFRGGIRGGIMTPKGPKVDANFKMESTAFNHPLNLVFTQMGDRMHVTRHAFTKWFEKKSQTYRTEMTLDNYDFDAVYAFDKSAMHIPSDYHWTSQTSWLSLLNMAGTPGHMLWTTTGRTFYNKQDLPAAFIKATELKQPAVFTEAIDWS